MSHAVDYFDALDDWTKTGKSSTTALKKIIVDFSQHEGKMRWLFGGPRPRISPMLNAIVQDFKFLPAQFRAVKTKCVGQVFMHSWESREHQSTVIPILEELLA